MKNVKLQHWLIMVLAVVIGLVMFLCLSPVPNSNDIDDAPPAAPAEPEATSALYESNSGGEQFVTGLKIDAANVVTQLR